MVPAKNSIMSLNEGYPLLAIHSAHAVGDHNKMVPAGLLNRANRYKAGQFNLIHFLKQLVNQVTKFLSEKKAIPY